MPPKTKRLKMLQESARRAREGLKREREGNNFRGAVTQPPSQPLLPPPTEVLVSDYSSDVTPFQPLLPPPTEVFVSDYSSDVSYDVGDEPPHSRLEEFVEEWVLSLSRDNVVALSLFLCYNLEKLVGFSSTNAAEYASIMLGKSDRTIRQWKADFLELGDIPDSQQGRHQRSGILWSSLHYLGFPNFKKCISHFDYGLKYGHQYQYH